MSRVKPASPSAALVHRLIVDGIEWTSGREGRASGDVETYLKARRMIRSGHGRDVPALYAEAAAKRGKSFIPPSR